MLTLYAIPVSLYCAKTRILLRHKRLEWKEVAPPGGYGSEAYRRIVPSGNLPALVDGDLLLADSEAIAEYLQERFPDPPALPDDPGLRAKVREFSRFHDTRLEPDLRKLFAHIEPGQRSADVCRRQADALNGKLFQLAHLLEGQADAGASLTLADCGYPITFAWMDALDPVLGLTLIWPPAVSTYRARLETLPPIAAELAEYTPRLTSWLAKEAG